MNFENLSTEGYVAFILAIIFTIVTIASAIYFARHKKINLVLNIFITLIFPILTVFCWTYLFMNLYAFDFAMSMYVSLGTAVGYGLLAFGISLLISCLINRKKIKNEEESIKEESNKNIEEELPVSAKTTTTPLLIVTPVEKTKTSEKQHKEIQKVQEKSVEETANAETVEDMISHLKELSSKITEEPAEIEEETENTIEQTDEVIEEETKIETVEDIISQLEELNSKTTEKTVEEETENNDEE